MPMPYTLTRGPLLTLLENALNPADAAETTIRNNTLASLRAPAPMATIPWVTSAQVSGVAIPRAPLDIRLDEDWLGLGDPPGQGTTGYWVGYKGNVDAVLREGLIRAIEVSIGIPHDGSPEEATRAWPVDIQWKCPNPYFEVWVTWRRHTADGSEGQVTMLIATPPDRVNRLVTEPRLPPAPPTGVPSAIIPLPEPIQATDKQGMWLVTHEHHLPGVCDLLVDTTGESETEVLDVTPGAHLLSIRELDSNTWIIPMPSTSWEDSGPVVVVAPPAYAGGADPARSNAP